MKKFLKQALSLVLLLCIMSLSFCGCGNDKNKEMLNASYVENSAQSISSGVVAENDIYELIWDDDKKCVLAHEKGTDNYWSNTPYEHYLIEDPSGVGHVRMSSAFYLEYLSSRKLNTAYSYVAAYMNGDVIAEVIDSGVKVTFYMSELEISLPLEYRINGKNIEVSVDVKNIRENENLVYSVSVSPFMCSAKNNDKDSYIFVPSGSGSLMYVDDGGRNTRTFSEEVYGMDYATTVSEKLSNTENVAMPVFGAKYGEKAVCGIITEGAEIARIDAEVGNIEYGYSSVYSTFQLREVNTLSVKDSQGNMSQVLVNTKGMVDLDKPTVTYTPLRGEKADYMGMAEVYKNYLSEKYNLKKEEKNSSDLYLQIFGGAEITTDFLGFSKRKLSVSTTFEEAKTIISDITKATNAKTTVQLKGYGHKGLDIDKIAGGVKFVKDFGNFDALNKWCDTNKVNLFVDYNVVNYRNGGLGVSKYSSASKTANKLNAKQLFYSIENYKSDSPYSYFYLKRDMIPEILDRVVKYSNKKGLDGISLESLGNISYSNYNSQKNYNKLGFSEIMANVADTVKKNGMQVMTEDSFDYAAVVSDHIISSVAKSSDYDGLDKDIPFYQIVFKGIVPLAVSPINLAINPNRQFLKAMETGTPLSFSVCDEWNSDLTASEQSVFQFCLYDIWKEKIIELYNSSKDYITSVKNSEITEHSYISENVVKTVFSCGVTVYVNYSGESVTVDDTTIPANGFIFK